MIQNYILWLIMILTIFFKALADGFNYKFNIEKNKKQKRQYGIIYHIFGALSIGTPMMSFFINIFSIQDVWIIILIFASIYFGLFDTYYNIITGKNILYIGKTDIIDILLNKFFSKTPFRKVILHGIKWLFFIFGTYLILDYL